MGQSEASACVAARGQVPVDLDLVVVRALRHEEGALREGGLQADAAGLPAGALPGVVGELRLRGDALGVAAPLAAQRAALEEDVRADARAVVAAVALDVQDGSGQSGRVDGAAHHSSFPRQIPRFWAICMNSLSAGHGSDLVDRFRQRHELHVRGNERHHRPVLAGLQGPHRPGAVAEAQLAVDGGRGAAPDPGPEDERIGFLGEQQLQPVRDGLGSLTRSMDDVVTGIAGRQRRQGRLEGGGLHLGLRGIEEPGPFGHHHQPVGPPERDLVLQPRRHQLEVAGDLGDQDGVGADGDGRPGAPPSRTALPGPPPRRSCGPPGPPGGPGRASRW